MRAIFPRHRLSLFRLGGRSIAPRRKVTGVIRTLRNQWQKWERAKGRSHRRGRSRGHWLRESFRATNARCEPRSHCRLEEHNRACLRYYPISDVLKFTLFYARLFNLCSDYDMYYIHDWAHDYITICNNVFNNRIYFIFQIIGEVNPIKSSTLEIPPLFINI